MLAWVMSGRPFSFGQHIIYKSFSPLVALCITKNMLVTDHEITLLLLKQKNQSISMQYWTLHGTAYKLMKAINEDISVNC